MGLLVKGEWQDKWYDTDKTGGRFQRENARFRNWITPSGRKGPTGEGGFKAEPRRYHLYVAWACPWAHRTLIFRKLKGLENPIGVSIAHPHMLENGWEYHKGQWSTRDRVNGFKYHWQLYKKAKADYTGRASVPVLWDRKKQTIVNNESADIIRIFNSAFDKITGNADDYYPAKHRKEIDKLNRFVYKNVNNGVYKAGFATSQQAYEEAYDALFEALDELDGMLSRERYLVGGRLTEADIRLFTTLLRFDAVYYSHFKCNKRRIADYENLARFVRDIYHHPGIDETVNMEATKQHYYVSHKTINPTGIVPKGPDLAYISKKL